MSTPLRVLIAEDSEDDALLLVRELRRGGFEPTFERVDTPDALQAALARQEWDIVVADYSMPHFSGRAALSLVRERGLDVPFIFLSGTIGEDTAVEAMRAGAQDYFTKGNLKRLLPAVERELRESEGRRQRRRADEALRGQQELLRTVIDTNPNLIFVKDWEGRFTLVNTAGAEVYGTTPHELVGKTDADFNPDQEEVEHFRRDDREVMTSGRAKLIAEEPVTNPSTGRTRWFQTVKVPLVLAEGTSRHILGVATDITERKQLEEQFRQAQKMEAVGRLAGSIAHDFNNLLTAIFGYADLLAGDLPGQSSALQDVEEIRKAAARAASLTRQLLAFSRQQVLEPTVLNVNNVVENLQKMLHRLIGEDVELRAVLAPGLGNVRADAGQLEQVIVNLAVNARDAMPAGGKLTIETANTELSEEYVEAHQPVVPGRYVMFTVSDTGVGMDPEVRARIFEPFFTTKEKGKGTGLGLSTVYGIVKQSGGYIWVYSEPGRGTTFKVYLPRVDAPLEAAERPRELEGPVAGTETILVAEDDELLRPLVRGILEKLGYHVLDAANTEEALTRAREHRGPIQLLLADVVMPGASGRDLAHRLAEARPETRVLYVSGYTDEAIVHHGLLDPGLNYLQKPFTPRALARRVRDVLDAT
jgi:hypothetical protein